MALLELQLGPSPQFQAASAADGDEYKNSGPEYLLLVLQSAVQMTVTNPHAGHEDYIVSLLPGSTAVPRFDPLWWNDPKTGRLTFEFDNPIGVLIALVRTGVIRADPNAAPAAGLF